MTTADVGIRSGNVLVPYVSVTKQTKWLDINTYVTISGATTPSGRTKSSGVAFARFSADSAGQWYMEAEISITLSDTVTAVVLAIAGVTFKTGINQAMSHISIDGRAYAYAVGNNIQIESTAAAGTHVVSANVMLQSEPTWTSLGTTAVAALEGVIAADVYIAPASASEVGLVDTSAQSFAGVKTFNDGVKQSYGCRVYLASANVQTITAGAAAATVAFATERWDPNNNHANGVYTAPKTGLYYVSYVLQVTNGATAATSVQTYVLCSGAADLLLASYNETMANSKVYNISGNGLVSLTAADTLAVKVSCVGQNLTVNGSGGANDVSFFHVHYLGPIV
jgi:hypothetical protein